MLTTQELMEAMGSTTTEKEADAMEWLLRNRGITNLEQVTDDEFFRVLVPEALKMAAMTLAECRAEDAERRARGETHDRYGNRYITEAEAKEFFGD